MVWVDSFRQRAKESFPNFFPSNSKTKIKIIAEPEIDSLIASVFLIKAFQHFSFNFSFSFQKKITEQLIDEIEKDSAELIILVYQGIAQNIIEKINKRIIIFNQQKFSQEKKIPISSLVYFFCKEYYHEISNLSYLLPIPYIHNNSEPDESIIQESLVSKKLDIKKGLAILSSQTLPLHKSIANTLYPYLPGISGSEDEAVSLLIENNIPLRENNRFRNLTDLNEEETKRLLTSILLKRLGSEKNPEMVMGNTYTMVAEDENSFIKDLKCFAFLLESCLAFSKYSLAVSICLNPSNKSMAIEYVNNTLAGIVSAMNYYLDNRKSILNETGKIAIISMNHNLDYRLISIFSKALFNSNIYSGKIIAISLMNPASQIIFSLESDKSLYNLLESLPKTINIKPEDTNSFTLYIHQEQEETLIKALLEA